MALRIPPVAACCSRASASSPLAWESSFVSSWFLRSAEARSSVGEAVMTTRFPYNLPGGFGPLAGKPVRLRGMLRDVAARWNVLHGLTQSPRQTPPYRAGAQFSQGSPQSVQPVLPQAALDGPSKFGARGEFHL